MTSRPLRADLHVHSTASDGTLSPRAVVELAAAAGITHLSITDHDSVDGLPEARAAASLHHIELIDGVELSAVSPDGHDVHVLGYFIDPSNPVLVTRLADLRDARRRRAELMIESLARAGIAVTLADVLRFSDGGAVGRAHIARAIVAAGQAASVADAFDRFIGRHGPHYVAKDVRTPHDAISCIRDAGGLAVIAHPAVAGYSHLIDELATQGLNGVEAYHADHTEQQSLELAHKAEHLGLVVTGGSDFHGPQGPNPTIGSTALPAADLQAFLAARPA